MRGIDINEENLEDLLTYDDLFLDYFNAFLQLPVFPQPLYYNRLTGTFVETQAADGKFSAHVARPVTPPYGATDEERERMLEWAKEDRLPLFLKTQLFREFKLCKMLLRPLDDRCSASRASSRMLRGYSRQTESYISSLSNSVDNSANDADFDDDNLAWGEAYGFHRSALYRYKRPGSNAYSLPPKLGLGPEKSCHSASADTRTGSSKENSYPSAKLRASADSNAREQRQMAKHLNMSVTDSGGGESTDWTSPGGMPSEKSVVREPTFTTRNDTLVSIKETKNERSKNRSASSRKSLSGRRARLQGSAKSQTSNHASQLGEGELVPDFDTLYGEDEPPVTGEALVNFAEDIISDQQTETDVKQLEGKHKMTLQEIKEHVMGSVDSFVGFMSFLKGTVGNFLLHFWLDCEYFKDTMEDYDETQINATRNRLFRDIQDKYKMNLTLEARQHITQAASNVGLGHNIFIRTQYDVLRRLRAYWVPRYLIHKERLQELSTELQQESHLMAAERHLLEREASSTCFFPSISLVNSMPVKADDVLHIAQTRNWETVSKGGRQLDARVKSAKFKVWGKPKHRTLREKLILALTADKAAGGPFKSFLNRHQDETLMSGLLFWEDATEYGLEEDRFADRLLRMCHAWAIYNKYISPTAPHPIAITEEHRNSIHKTLLASRDFVEASVFHEVKDNIVDALEKAWIRYLKEDLKAFIDCHIRSIDSPPSTAEEIEVLMDEVREQLIVRRPRPWVSRYPPSTESERGRRLRTALSMAESIDEARRAEQRKRAKERRKLVEKERKKAVRAARQRQRDAKRQKSMPFKKTPEKVEGEEDYPPEEAEEEKSLPPDTHTVDEVIPEEDEQQSPTFAESVAKKGVVSLFKKYVMENEGKDVMNLVNLYLDIEAYYNITDGGKVGKGKKDIQSSFIFKTYMEHGARKKVHLSDVVYNRLRGEKERPRTPTLRESQKYIVPQIEEYFTAFWNSQAEELGIDQKALATMSKVELAMRSDDPALLTGWQKKKGKVGGKGNDRQRSNLSGLSHSSSMSQIESDRNEPSDTGNSQGGPRRRKPDGRSQPSREDKVNFLVALSNAAAGHLPIQMLYFYKYLVKHSEEDGNPLIDRDLFFYCEVQKFKDGSHAYADEELLRRKVQSIMDVYLDSNIAPSLQIDLPGDIHQKSIRLAQRYLTGKDVNQTIFDEAQYCVFKELLPYWAGFVRTYKPPEDDKKRILTRRERDRAKRLEDIVSWQPPNTKNINLPLLPKGAAVAAFTFSINDGMKWRDSLPLDEGRETALGSVDNSTPGPLRLRKSNTMVSSSTEMSKRSLTTIKS